MTSNALYNYNQNKMDIKNNVEEIKQLDNQRKGVLFALIFILFVVSIVVGAYLTRNPSLVPQIQKPQVTLAPSTSLSMNPGTLNLKVGEKQTVSVDLSTIPVSAIDLGINFDPSVVSISNVTNGEVFDKVIVNKVAEGKMMYSASVSPDNPTETKEGTVLTFTVTALKPVETTLLDFNLTDTITALNGLNTLGVTTGTNITIAE